MLKAVLAQGVRDEGIDGPVRINRQPRALHPHAEASEPRLEEPAANLDTDALSGIVFGVRCSVLTEHRTRVSING